MPLLHLAGFGRRLRSRCRAVLLLGVGPLALGACDETARPTEAAPKQAAAPVAAPTQQPVPAPSVAPDKPKAEKPRKTLADCPRGPAVAFPNEEFESAVRIKLQKPRGDVTTADLGRLRSLNVSQTKLDELDVCLFSHMKNLRELFLGRGNIEDLSPIAGSTKLESLRASLNPITDLKPLEGMTKMDRLDLAHTQIQDLSPLSAMKALTELLIDSTPVSDVKALAALQALEVLVLKDTRVKDVSPLKSLDKLKTLDIRGAPVENAETVMRPGLRVQDY